MLCNNRQGKFLCIKQGKEFKLPYEENQPINESIRNVINT